MDVRITFLYILVTVIIENNIFCENGCGISIKARIIDTCPSNRTEMEESARKLNCQKYRNKTTCGNIYYHCVLNEFGNETLEVCAPKTEITGGHCTEFNEEGKILQANLYLDCTKFKIKPCEIFYYSTDAHLYKECYNYTNNAQLLEEAKQRYMALTQQNITTLSTASPQQNITTLSTASPQQPTTTQQPKQTSLDKAVSESDNVILGKIIAVEIAVMLVIILFMSSFFIYKLNKTGKEVKIKQVCRKGDAQNEVRGYGDAENEALMQNGQEHN